LNETVEIGNKYLIMLAGTEEGSTLYTLSSKNSVYLWDEALRIPELTELISGMKPFIGRMDPYSDEEILEMERSALVD